MGFIDNWKRLVAWWSSNAKSNEKKLSAGFSWLLVILIGAITVPLIATVQGGPATANWEAFYVIAIGTLAGFLIMLIESVFGKREAPDTSPIITTPT